MIVTLTLNPCIDKSTTVKEMVPEKKLQCTFPKWEPGGGGLNVSRALKRLGTESTCVFPSGGNSGITLNQLLQHEGIVFQSIHTTNETRENFIVVELQTNNQFRFGMPGAQLSQEELEQCIQAILQIENMEYLIVSGSLPDGVPLTIFDSLSAIAREKRAKLIIDTSGAALKQAVQSGVYLIKPNLGELASLVNTNHLANNEAAEAARRLIHLGKCQIIIVSMGKEGAILISKDHSVMIFAPTVDRKSTVGAGDSMVAGMIHGLQNGMSIPDAARYGVACGSAATMNPGTELCKKIDADRLFQIIQSKDVE